ncbi:hypothetical protein [Ruania alba]|uniref:Uncharacterized protein n=1 Tax=Ruania alba TaxID=648782 RepID=A0A1H5L3I9_9MICO|nr:hypothetical protein [Ruania alba]SEE70798.1 hypothetical protein SAMN04488554_2562 [Ruania alba]
MRERTGWWRVRRVGIVAVIGGATAMIVGGGLAVSTLAQAEEPARTESTAEASTAAAQSSSRSQALTDAIAALEQNRDELAAQVDEETADARNELSMPPGAEFGPVHVVEDIESQIAWLSGSDGQEQLDSGAVEPQEHRYQDGAFASLMAIDWKCAWLSAGVAGVQASDSEAVSEAVRTLHSFTETEYVQSFPDYNDFLGDLVDPLRQGDATAALEYLPSCEDSTRVDH